MTETSGTHVWLVLMKAHRAVAAHAQRSFGLMELGAAEFIFLEALLHKGPQLVSSLGERMKLTSGSATSAVGRLVKRGLVKRTTDVTDRRARVVTLTPKGRTVIAKAFAEHRERMDSTAASLSTAERTQLMALLKKLGRAAEASLTPEP